MRRVLLIGVLVATMAAVTGPDLSGAAPVAAPLTTTASADAADPGYQPYEAELTRGGFVEFGARLAQRRPNSAFTCRTAFGGARPQAPSCTWEAQNFTTGESFQPPIGLGRITQIRVRVGGIGTGPMRVEVLEALRPVTPTGRICCRLVRRSQVFTPAPNSITTINTNLPIFQSAVPNGNGVYVDQRLALTMLRGNVPIPARFDTAATGTTGLSAWYPGWSFVGQERTGPAGASGLMVLLRARWRPA